MVDSEHSRQQFQTPGARLGAQEATGISTLEPGQKPPSSPSGKLIPIKVQMLDDTQEVHKVPSKASGKHLLDLICHNLNLIESDYFALEFLDHHKVMVWLDLLKPIVKQVRRPRHVVMRFVVKFFPPDHTQLQEELTRYLFALQIKQDLALGRMMCNDTSAALLVSHIIQSEIGDFDESICSEHLAKYKYIPQQDALEERIKEFHRSHVGQTPATSDYLLLEVARKLETYGIRQHRAKDREGTKINLSVSHTGIIVFQGNNKINSFNWAKVRKLSFKRKRFLIKFRPETNSYQDTLEFTMTSRDSCKTFWKICVEYHAFFRLFEEPKPKPKPILFSRGSSFRFSGRTQKQLLDYVKEGGYKKAQFERKHSKMQSIRSLPDPQSLMPKQNDGFSFGTGLEPTGPVPPNERKDAEVSGSTAERPAGRRSRSPSRSPVTDGQEEEEEAREARAQRGPHHAGPASRAAHTSCSSIPYIDCSDPDSEHEPGPLGLLSSLSWTNDNREEGFTQKGCPKREEVSPGGWGSPDFKFVSPSLNSEEELTDGGMYFADWSFHTGRVAPAPRHSSLLHEAFHSPLSPSATPIGPVKPYGGLHKGSPKGFLAQNGYCEAAGTDHHPLSGWVHGPRNRSETDPFVLSRVASTPLSGQWEGRHVGLHTLRRAYPTSPPFSQLLPAAAGASQPADGSSSSGTESTDSDPEAICSSGCPLAFGNCLATHSSSPAGAGFSFGSLQWEEDWEGEDSSMSFSDSEDSVPLNEPGVITC